MNCEFVEGRIYSWVYENMNQPDDELMKHIADCPGCNSYYEECQSAKRITSSLNRKQPVLQDPDQLTNTILDKIEELKPKKHSKRFINIDTVKKLLAAASVFLMITFGYEQYVVMEKMIKLEEQMSHIPGATSNSSHYQEIMSYYTKSGIELIRLDLASILSGSHNNDLKSLFITASSDVISHGTISRRFQDQLAYMNISNDELSVINKILLSRRINMKELITDYQSN